MSTSYLNGSTIRSRVSPTLKQLFVNVNVWDGTTHKQQPQAMEVLVVGNVITRLEKPGVIQRDADTKIIDGHGTTLMPGLVEGHAHLSFPDSFDFDIPPEEHTLITMHGAKKLLDAGFTSAFSAASAKMRLDVVIRNEINSGRIPGPRLRAASPELTSPGGLGDGIVIGLHESNTFGYPCVGALEITKACQLFKDQGVDTIKINICGEKYTTDGNDIVTTFTDEEVEAAVKFCQSNNLKSAAHCRGSDAVRKALQHEIEVIYHCEYADDESINQLVSKKDKIFLAPAFGFLVRGGTEPAQGPDKKVDVTIKTYKKLFAAAPDIRVLIGGDYGFPPTPQGENAYDLELFVTKFGLSPPHALICATNYGGQIMSMPVGQIIPGYFADILLVDGNPCMDVTLFQNKQNIKLIMQDGFVYKNIL